jgi:hypothetical protein
MSEKTEAIANANAGLSAAGLPTYDELKKALEEIAWKATLPVESLTNIPKRYADRFETLRRLAETAVAKATPTT